MAIFKNRQTLTDKEKSEQRNSYGTIEVKFEPSQINGNLTAKNEEINDLSKQLFQKNAEIKEQNEMIEQLKTEIRSLISEAAKTKKESEIKWNENQNKIAELEEENVKNRDKLFLLNAKTIDYDKFRECEIEVKKLMHEFSQNQI